MNAQFTPHLSTLPPDQRQIWPELKKARDLGFVLYGGTAIALHLGHRVSVDFDLFTDRKLNHRELNWATNLLAGGVFTMEVGDSVTAEIKPTNSDDATVKLSFFGEIDFGRIGTPVLTDDGVLHVASLQDLFATKLKVILQRAEAKDYLDVIALLDAGLDLAAGLAGAKALYGRTFPPAEALKALTFFEDGDLDTLEPHQREKLILAAERVAELPSVQIISTSLQAPVSS